jgi:hypothetical protein
MMERMKTQIRDQERGAVLVLVMIVILMLLGFAALGVDATAAYAEKRQAQSEADAAVMAGALVYLTPANATGQEVADQVMAFAAANAPGTPPTPTDWANCTDALPPGYSPLEDVANQVISPCISLKQVSDAPALLRVRTPNWDMPTSFAGLIGYDTVAISATATAELRYESSLPILPFSLPANPSVEECMATSPSGLLPGDTAPCGGPAQGNFGLLDSPWFGAEDLTDSQPCPNDPNFNARAPHNLAYGLDHIITQWPGTPPANGSWLPNNHVGADSCANALSPTPPYVLQTQPGNTQSGPGRALLQDGFLGDDPSQTAGNLHGRLRQSSAATGTSGARLNIDTTGSDFDVDNVGLWEYLTNTDTPADPCDSSHFDGNPADEVGRELTRRLLVCLAGTTADFGTDVLPDGTGTDITKSPRFAVVPVLNYNMGQQFGSKWWAVLELKPVYLQSTWYECTGGQDKECLFQPSDFMSDPASRDTYSVLFNPGEAPAGAGPCYLSGGNCVTPQSSKFQLMGLSALVLEWDHLPGAENQLGGNAPFETFLHPNE